jgi:hypothetical protein
MSSNKQRIHRIDVLAARAEMEKARGELAGFKDALRQFLAESNKTAQKLGQLSSLLRGYILARRAEDPETAETFYKDLETMMEPLLVEPEEETPDENEQPAKTPEPEGEAQDGSAEESDEA